MKRSEVVLLSLICYLVPVLGPWYLLTKERDSRFAKVHARQMLALIVALVALIVGWLVVGWIASWVPTAGPMVAAMLFTLVVAGLIGAVIVWLIGLIQALRGRMVKLPVVWAFSSRLFGAEV